MRHTPSDRQDGTTLIMVMIFLLLLLSLSANLTMTSVVGVRANAESEVGMRAFYLADSGAQAGIARVRASNGTLGSTSWTEAIAGGSASVGITKSSSDLYRINSNGTFRNQQKAVEVYVKFTSNFSLPGAYTLMFGKGSEIESANIPVSLQGSSIVSGNNHAPDGSLTSSQSAATDGLAMNSVPGNKNFAITGSGVAEGVPDATTNKAANMGSSLKAIVTYAKTYADVKISGSKNLGTADTGSYGTDSAPKLVYATVGENGYVNMSGNFTGYGTLVIKASETEKVSMLQMSQFATWNGLVLIYISKEAEEKGGALVRLSDQAKILGGFAMMFNGEEIEIRDTGKLLQESETASILYSTDLISSAPGTSVASSQSAEVISYRIP